MEFEWDRTKAERNHRKHRVSFDEAVTVFYDALAATFEDPDRAAGEQRFITVGQSSRGRLLVVAHVERGKYHKRILKEGANVVVLEPDVARAFPNSAVVNDTLRTVLKAARAARRSTPRSTRRLRRTA